MTGTILTAHVAAPEGQRREPWQSMKEMSDTPMETNPDREHLFDRWAAEYDRIVPSFSGRFPFDGYEDVLDALVATAGTTQGMKVLDLGVGTGNLAERFVRRGCTVWGVDFSVSMLEKAREKLPHAHLLRGDLLGEWPLELPGQFDRIVSAYVLHEFDLTTKMHILRKAAETYLLPEGRLLIADISFPDVRERTAAGLRWAAEWDKDEHYWAADETLALLEREDFSAVYRQVSFCGGLFSLMRKTPSFPNR